MALTLDDEQVLLEGRVSWLGALCAWRSVVTLGLWAVIVRRTARYAITDERVASEWGVASDHERVVHIDEITDISTDQGRLGRIFGYGTVSVATADSGERELTLWRIRDPENVAGVIESVRNGT